MKTRLPVILLVFLLLPLTMRGEDQGGAVPERTGLLESTELPTIPDALGVAGPFVGVHRDHLIVAGGANFPRPVWENDKVWRDRTFALPLAGGESDWIELDPLPRPTGYGATLSVEEGLVCIGGNDANGVFAEVFLWRWEEGDVVHEELPSLPEPLCYAGAARSGDDLYVAGGQTGPGLETAVDSVWRLDWSRRGEPGFAWEKMPPIPGPARAFPVLAAQSNGRSPCLYLFGGRTQRDSGQVEFLREALVLDPLRPEEGWSRVADLPEPRAAGTGLALGQSHVVLLGGDDGKLFGRADELGDRHPGFPERAWAYHTITDTWVDAGKLSSNQVTTSAVAWRDGILVASGEVRPRVRTPAVRLYRPAEKVRPFAAANWIAIGLYLGAVVGIGVWFSKRNRNTDDFFRGGQRIPGWVAGLSIFATLLSSITFIALPARAYATDWVMMVVNAGILICAPLVVVAIVPRFRSLDVTSAYQYLEERFHLVIRLFAGLSFVLFQVGRMAIVMYLPALALATITPLTTAHCILVMGVLSIVYCSLGGLEAVVWTDALQAIVLIGGALLSFAIILANLDGGWTEFVSVAGEKEKFRWADFDFGPSSYLTTAFWVVLLGGIGSSLIPYSSDQAVVQRYVSTPSEARARSAVWLNAIMAGVATVLFFGLGTALYVFYRAHPGQIDPSFPTDSIFPLFIARELPVGISGLVIAAVFAAAQSTISSSMNSTSTVLVTDFFRRLGGTGSEKSYLRLARVLTVVLGGLGTGFALLLAASEMESAWQTFLMIIGFVMGPLCGLFLLGMFTRRATTVGAVVGAVAGVAALVGSRFGTEMHGLLYAPIGILVTFVTGWLASFGGGRAKAHADE